MFTRNTLRAVTALFALASTASIQAGTLKVPAHFPTISAAIDAAVSGDKVVISAGTYFENLNVPSKSDLVIKAKGKVVVDAGGAAYAMSIGLGTNVTVRGLTFKNASVALGRIFLGHQNRFENCSFKGGSGQGVRIFGGSENGILDCLVQDVPSDGVDVDSDSSYVAGCKVVNCGELVGNAGIQLVGAYLTAEANQIVGGAGSGIVIGAMGVNTHNVLAIKNEITDVGFDGITMFDAIDCLVMDNIVKDADEDGIDLDDGSAGNTFDGNRISRAGSTGFESSGYNNTVYNNRIKKSGISGVRIYVNSTDSFWFENKVKQSGEYGFRVDGAGHSFGKNVAKGSVNADLLDDAAEGANDYVGNVFGTTSN